MANGDAALNPARLAIQRAAGLAMQVGDQVDCYGHMRPTDRTRHTIVAKREGTSHTGVLLRVDPPLRNSNAARWVDSGRFIRAPEGSLPPLDGQAGKPQT